jgi:type II secretory pathway pseudopilin PulG
MSAPVGRGTSSAGFCWVEVLLVMACAALVAALAVPLTARTIETLRARDAAGFVAARVRLARQQAVSSAQSVALVFDVGPRGWSFRVCRDDNGNGVRRTEIDGSVDRCVDGPWTIGDLFPGMQVRSDPAVPDPDGGAGSSDAVRLGRGDMTSCSSLGNCSPGTIFFQSSSSEQYAVRIGSVMGRTRLLRFDRAAWRWVVA